MDFHAFHEKEIKCIQKYLIKWYKINKRQLPWRDLKENSEFDEQTVAYRVLVSEIMLQQTQVATVISYYNNWIKKWPNLLELSQCSLDEVNEMWKGLGYYKRAARLHQLAIKVQTEMEGKLPKTSQELIKLPGIGKYTAGAISSIVFNEPAPAVDGNVLRVITRLTSISSFIDNLRVSDKIACIVKSFIPLNAPGDFNQALMELGSLVCTPKNPKCSQCPLNKLCKGYNRVLHQDIEDCFLCDKSFEYDENKAVENFPRKTPKNPIKKQTAVTFIIKFKKSFYMRKRNSSGLLGNLWEFPNFPKDNSDVNSLLKTLNLVDFKSITFTQSVSHLFSHIHQTYSVYQVIVSKKPNLLLPKTCCDSCWVTSEQFEKLCVSKAMQKVFVSVR